MNSILLKTIISTCLFAISFFLYSQSGTEILASETEYEDPFNTVDLDLVVTDPYGISQRVPAFWAGGNTWKVRYSSSKTGEFF